MNLTALALVLLLLHLLVCLLLWRMVRKGLLDAQGYFLPFMLLIPFWGPICVLLLTTRNALTDRAVTPPDLEKLRINEELFRSILVENHEARETTVPLEEALIVNSAEQRRKLIFSVLNDDPMQYYDLLQQARMNEDSEVVHYAATAMAQISKQADLTLQRHEADYAAKPNDPEVLAAYSRYLGEYLDSGLVQGRAAEIQQRQLIRLLKQQLTAGLDFRLGCRLAQAYLAMQEYDEAERVLEKLTAQWPQREEPWLLRLRSAADRKDGDALRKTIHNIQEQDVYLSAKGRETLRFWQNEKED